MKFVDTLICSIDTLRLESFSNTAGAVFSWAPQYNMIGSNSDRPFVFPKQTTTYGLTVTYNGCVAEDSVLVNVIDRVSLNLPNDTTICGTDSMQIIPNTNALYFTWSPSAGLSDPKAKTPVASPLANTTYSVVGSVGKCTAQDAMNVRVVPYPQAQAGFDALVCYGKTVQLRANIKGADFKWFPTSSLINSNSLDPVAGPQSTTSYVLSVTDTLGCPKPVTDTVVVTVIPKVQAFAGNDTSIVVNQPLQLNAAGGSEYVWSPTTYLSNPLIFNPVAMLPAGKDSMSYRVKVSTPEGCTGYDSLNIYVFETLPEIFVPNAFTPNHDGINDVFRAKLAGMKRLYYFRVFNRWGELLYSTSDLGKGWDGTFNGRDQASGTYVWAAKATDYKDNTVMQKGTFVLIR
jgi:gliding motility-associated-like protein